VTKEPIISVSGLRGVVGETLTPEVARRYAAAFAEVLPPGSVIVTRDGRSNGGPLVPAVVAGITRRGDRNVLDGGIAATPTIGVLVRQHACAGGIQISASHNPAEYNGIKLIWGDGHVVAPAIGEEVRQKYLTIAGDDVPEVPAVQPTWLDDTTAAHLALVEDIVDVARIRTRRLRVVLDSNHGSGSVLGRMLLEHLGCDVRMIGEKPDGQFAHPPEPTAENLAGVLSEVMRLEANVGFCQDPDADRLAIIDEGGRYLGEEYTLAICAEHVVRQTPGPLVMNCSTSRMTEDIARKYSVPFHRSAVGEANVVEMMLATEAVFGGEGNGGVIDPRVGLIRDSFVGMALVLDAMAVRGKPVSALAAELPRYAICKTAIQLDREKVPAALAALEREFAMAESDHLDGLRLDWGNPDGSGCWLLVRPSNTEPIVRLVAEAPTADGAQRLCDEGKRVIREAVR
jgi:phosphomannomutase